MPCQFGQPRYVSIKWRNEDPGNRREGEQTAAQTWAKHPADLIHIRDKFQGV